MIDAPNPPLDPWEPLPPAEAAALFGRLTVPGWVAGGIAIEMAVGRPLRSHGDLDVRLPPRGRSAVRHALRGWEPWAADPPGRLRPRPPA
ncbi:nucleotidyltransferase domain-containing protein [Nocardiopsis mangrovi]|uniref:Nucleotidyltransferase domain-containing protein n=1 Tax=Nocardiopsis mangrovi TaxID=1179818 RepID=A0ABV9E1N2_9ACTN